MELLNTHPIKKSDLGFHGNLFGGKLLAWIDAAAAGYSMQLCDSPRMVTVSIDKCNFEKPAKESQLLKIYGKPQSVGHTSVTLYMEARAHNVYTGKQINVFALSNIVELSCKSVPDAKITYGNILSLPNNFSSQ